MTQWDARVRRELKNPDSKYHGRATGYQHGCRCDKCCGWKKEKNHAGYLNREYAEKLDKAITEMNGEQPHVNNVKENIQKKAAKSRAKKQKKHCCTINELYLPMMDKPSVKRICCCVCGTTSVGLAQHHVVKRSAGKWIDEQGEHKKPTITLCGMNNSYGCHGLAHHELLHFRWVDAEHANNGMGALANANPTTYGCGHWEYLRTEEPTKYQDALAMDGWKRL